MAFALVAPLGAYYHGDSHSTLPFELPGSPGEQRGCPGVRMVRGNLLVARCSDQGPGKHTAGSWLGETPMLDQPAQTQPEGCCFVSGQQVIQGLAQL